MGKTNNKIFYGWYVIVVMWIAYFLCTTPISYGASVIMLRMVQEGVLKETSISYASSLRFAATAVGSILISMLIKKKGGRFTVLFGTTIMIVCQFLNFAFKLSDPMFILVFGTFGIGMVSAGVVTGPAVVNAWFDRNKAFPMAIVMTAGAIGGFIFPVVTDFLVNHWNWRICWLIYSGLTVFAFVAVFAVMKDHPEQVGDVKDGRAWLEMHPLPRENTEENEAAGEKAEDMSDQGMKEIAKSPRFYGMGFLSFMNRAFFAGFTCYLLLYAVENGLTATQGALALSIYNVAGLAGRMIAGTTDRIPLPAHMINAISYIPLVVGGFLLAMHPGLISFYAGSALYGFGVGFAFTFFPLLVSACFGSKEFAVLYGLYNSVAGVGSTLTPLILSVAIGALGSYKIVYVVLMIAPIICAAAAMTMPVKKQR